MPTLSRVAYSVLVLGLVLTLQLPVSGQPAKGIQVRILLYSGRPDPTYVLASQKALDYVKTHLASTKSTEFRGSTVIPAVLGYKGVLVENVGRVAGIPGTFAIYNGTLETVGAEKRFYADQGRILETFLVDQAVKNKVLDAELAKRFGLRLGSPE